MKGTDVFPMFVPADIQRWRLIVLNGRSWGRSWCRSILRLVRFLGFLFLLLLYRSRGGWGRRGGCRVVLSKWWGWWGSQRLNLLCSRTRICV